MSDIVYTTPSGRFVVKAEHDDDAESPWMGDPGFEYDFQASRYLEVSSDNFPALHHKDYWWYPVYAYIHSGIIISLGKFTCPWDSGQLGWVAVKRPSRGGEWTTQKAFLKYLEAMVGTYNDYLAGNCFGYVVVDTEADEELDSCWGYYGDDHEKSGLLESGRYAADYEERKHVSTPDAP